MVNDSTVYRVIHKPNDIYEEGNAAASIYDLAPILLSQSSLNKSEVKLFLKKIEPYVKLLSDESGRIIFLSDNTVSVSSFLEFCKYFLRWKGISQLSEKIPRPIDADKFLALLKSARVPARFLNTILLTKPVV